jgi:CheY-like chemotaxis protein
MAVHGPCGLPTPESFSSTLAGGCRTLIVDDNQINLRILERTLKIYFSHLVSPDITVATSGNAALQLNSPGSTARSESPTLAIPPSPTLEPENPFDLILLDIDMPDISGIQVAERIRTVHNNQSTAIVAVTTSTEPEQQRTYEMVGMDGVVGKPIDLGVLDRVVSRALLSRRSRDRPQTSFVPSLPKDIIPHSLQEDEHEILSDRKNSTASTATASTLYDDSLSRRSSYPPSIEESHQTHHSSLADFTVSDLTEQLLNVSVDTI